MDRRFDSPRRPAVPSEVSDCSEYIPAGWKSCVDVDEATLGRIVEQLLPQSSFATENSCPRNSGFAAANSPQVNGSHKMPVNDSVVATYDTHEQAEQAIKELQKDGIDMKSLSIAGKNTHTDEQVVGYY